MKRTFLLFSLFVVCLGAFSRPTSNGAAAAGAAAPAATASEITSPSPTAPASPVKLLFIHHSTGQAWLEDGYGGLGNALRDNNYFVSDTNYGWGLASIGSSTDIGNWYTWFRGTNSAAIMADAYAESEQHSTYSRLASDPGGENKIIMFKSCFPNSSLRGSTSDAIPAITSNPLRGQSVGSNHTISNAKGIYNDLLNYFQTRRDKLFVVIAAPPLRDSTYAANARAFNNWLVDDWLDNYPYKNVAVFDYYTVLTSNGGSASTNDLGSATGNHHRYYNNAIQHVTTGGANTLAYPTGDDHPSSAGDKKATGEFLPMLNIFYNAWNTEIAYTEHLYLSAIQK